jgi:putative ABC transport system permease protein
MLIRQAIRVLWNRPAFTVIALLTIGVGIGASTAIFSVVDAALLRDLPFREPDRLAVISGVAGAERDVRWASHPEVMDWRAMTRSFAAVSIYDETTLDITDAGEAVQLEAELVSAGFFELLGVAPAAGRTFSAEDDQPGVQPVVVISDALWRTRFASDPNVVGQTVRLSAGPATVVGIMPAGFRGLSFDTEIWTTLPPLSPGAVTDRGSRWLAALGRLAPGITFEQAQQDLIAVTRELEATYPDINRERSADVSSLHEFFLDSTLDLLPVLLGAVLFLLLIACANVTNLQLVRGIARSREIALRYALGANRAQIVKQLLTEALVLSLAGGLLGLMIGYWSIQLLLPLIPDGTLPAYAVVDLNTRALAFGIGLAAVAGLLSGIVPALRSTASGVSTDLRGDGRSVAGRPRRFGLQQALVVAEIAIALPLLVSAGLMARSLRQQLATEPGFRAERAVAARLALPARDYTSEARIQFAGALADRLRALPGISDVAIGSNSPLRGNSSAAILEREGHPDEGIRYYRHLVMPGWFRTLGIRVLNGREFEPSDDYDAPPVAMVTQALAARFWPGEDALGKRLRIAGDWVTVIGVVDDVRYRDLTTSLMDPGEDPDVFISYAQLPSAAFDIVVRTEQAESAIASLIQREVSALDPSVPIFRVQSLSAAVAAQTASDRFGSSLLALFACLSLALAAIGLYGVMAFVVGMRRREIAIRLAVGADPRSALSMVLRQGMTLVALGTVLGLAGALAAGKLLENLLFGVSTRDPLTFIVVALVLTLVAFAANYIPAHRATRIDPQMALKS